MWVCVVMKFAIPICLVQGGGGWGGKGEILPYTEKVILRLVDDDGFLFVLDDLDGMSHLTFS